MLGVLLLYAISFAVFYPRVATNSDETQFIAQARLMLEGTVAATVTDPFTGKTFQSWAATFPVGTAALMTPFIAAFGWRGAFVVPWLGLVLAVVITARWLQQEGRSPGFALLILGFPPTLVMGRVAMSDVPSAALVAVGLWLFWRGLDRSWPWWLASGFIAGASLTVRVTNALPFVPFFTGTLLRREGASWALVVGGLAGVALRFATMQIYFGDFRFERGAYYFSPETLLERVPLYLVGLLVFVPGGLILALAYRGRRWPELNASVGLFIGFYLLQVFSTAETGLSKRWVLGLRYLIPLLPLLAFGMAEATPRLWRRLVEARTPGRRAGLERGLAALLALWIAAVSVASLAVHPAFARWSTTQADLGDAIHRHVGDEAVLVTNWPATRKFLRALDRRYTHVDRDEVTIGGVQRLVKRHGELYIALLERSDSDYWRRDIERSARFMARLKPPPELVLDQHFTPTDRLRIWRVTHVVRR